MSGKRPFAAESYPALLPLIIEAPHPALPASVPAGARTVVAGSLAKDRADRYPSADALLQAIQRARAALPAEDGISTWSGFFVSTGEHAERPVPPPRRTGPRHGLALAIFAVPVFILIAAAASGLQRSHAPPPGREVFAPPAPEPVPAAQPVEMVEPVPPSLAVAPAMIPASVSAVPASRASAEAARAQGPAEERRKRTGIEPAQDSGTAPHRF
jgi:eukaryotic-like serine/threonine-protein kinase